MALFLSTYVNKVDKKGRISVPAPFRAAIDTRNFAGVVLFRSPTHNCLEGFDFDTMMELSNRLDQFDLFSSAQDDLATTIFGEASQCAFDGEGRITISSEFLNHAGIDGDAVIVGLGRKFQIWNKSEFDRRQKTARDNVKERGLTIPNPKVSGGAQSV